MIEKGIINLYKPQNMTSHDCVAILRRKTGIRRIGHTGTLDPMAVGVLPLCVGTSARITEYLDLDRKVYRGTLQLGISTDTQDIWGTVLSDSRETLKKRQRIPAERLTEEQIRQAARQLTGVISQTPPKFSALKVGGRKLYEYARAGEPVEIRPRMVYIEEFKVENYYPETLEIRFQVTCSKGTYIRSLCTDLAEALGETGVLSALERRRSGIFTAENAVSLEELQQADPETLASFATGTDAALETFGAILLPRALSADFFAGKRIPWERCLQEGDILRPPYWASHQWPLPFREEFSRAYCVYFYGENRRPPLFLGVGFFRPEENALKADKVFASDPFEEHHESF